MQAADGHTTNRVTEVHVVIALKVKDIPAEPGEKNNNGAVGIYEMRWCRGLPMDQRNELCFGEFHDAYQIDIAPAVVKQEPIAAETDRKVKTEMPPPPPPPKKKKDRPPYCVLLE